MSFRFIRVSKQAATIVITIDNKPVNALHPDVWRLGRLRPRTSREDTVSHIRQCSTGADRQAFAITAADGRCVGAVMLRGGPALAFVAYWLARPWWGDALLLAAVLGAMRGVGRFTQKADATPPPEEAAAAN